MASARAAYLAGFATTSNLRAGMQYGVPTGGASAHAFTLVHDNERDAFQAQLDTLGPETTLLVTPSTWPPRWHRRRPGRPGTGRGPDRLRRPTRSWPGRCGPSWTRWARPARIVLTGDLDEYSIAALTATPVDGYGVGTSLVIGSGAPTAALVYKLVARTDDADATGPLRPVAKRSVGKPGRGGRKWAARRRDESGTAVAELVTTAPPDLEDGDRALQRQLVRGGEIIGREPLATARARHREAVAELPPFALQLCAAMRPSRPCSSRTTTDQPLADGQPPSGIGRHDGVGGRPRMITSIPTRTGRRCFPRRPCRPAPPCSGSGPRAAT